MICSTSAIPIIPATLITPDPNPILLAGIMQQYSGSAINQDIGMAIQKGQDSNLRWRNQAVTIKLVATHSNTTTTNIESWLFNLISNMLEAVFVNNKINQNMKI